VVCIPRRSRGLCSSCSGRLCESPALTRLVARGGTEGERRAEVDRTPAFFPVVVVLVVVVVVVHWDDRTSQGGEQACSIPS
jgi:hypothetical protein